MNRARLKRARVWSVADDGPRPLLLLATAQAHTRSPSLSPCRLLAMAAATEQPKPAPAQPAQPAPSPAKPASADAPTSTAAAEQSPATGKEGTEAEGKDDDALDLDVGPETGSVVDMDVFGQLLEIVRRPDLDSLVPGVCGGWKGATRLSDGCWVATRVVRARLMPPSLRGLVADPLVVMILTASPPFFFHSCCTARRTTTTRTSSARRLRSTTSTRQRRPLSRSRRPCAFSSPASRPAHFARAKRFPALSRGQTTDRRSLPILDNRLANSSPLSMRPRLALIDRHFLLSVPHTRTSSPYIRPALVTTYLPLITLALSSKKDLDALSRKGHFLKGSSAALGLQRVQHLCEALQHFGKRRDARGEGPEVSEEEALARCRALLGRLKKNQKEAKDVSCELFFWLRGGSADGLDGVDAVARGLLQGEGLIRLAASLASLCSLDPP